MFGFFKKKKEEEAPKAPEIMGLRLGGAIELDTLKFQLIEPYLTIEGAAKTQFITAVGEAKLDETTRVLRFYTDDEGFIQVLTDGYEVEDIKEVKLFYYYETRPIDTEQQWNDYLENHVVLAECKIDDHIFVPTWENTRPVAMTETIWQKDTPQKTVDQFFMLYERELENQEIEYGLISCEEEFLQVQVSRCVVYSTGIDLNPTDFTIIG